MRRFSTICWLFTLTTIFFFLTPVVVTPQAQSQPSKPTWWQGKTMAILVGQQPGGGQDTYARILARHLSKYLPGNPTIIVRNMPEGRGLGMFNQFYKSKPDGLTLGAVDRNTPFQQMVGMRGIQFDMLKVSWLGSAMKANQIFFVRAEKGASMADIKRANQILHVSSGGVGSAGHIMLRCIQLAFDLKFNFAHYDATGERMLAVERGEADAGHADSDPFLSSYKHLLDKGIVKVIFQTALEKDPRFPDALTAPELLKQLPSNQSGAKALLVYCGSTDLGRPFAGPPDIPKDRLDALRIGFEKTLKDPDLLAEAKKLRIAIEYIRREKIEGIVKEILSQPPEVVSIFKTLVPE